MAVRADVDDARSQVANSTEEAMNAQRTATTCVDDIKIVRQQLTETCNELADVKKGVDGATTKLGKMNEDFAGMSSVHDEVRSQQKVVEFLKNQLIVYGRGNFFCRCYLVVINIYSMLH